MENNFICRVYILLLFHNLRAEKKQRRGAIHRTNTTLYFTLISHHRSPPPPPSHLLLVRSLTLSSFAHLPEYCYLSRYFLSTSFCILFFFLFNFMNYVTVYLDPCFCVFALQLSGIWENSFDLLPIYVFFWLCSFIMELL